MADIYLYAEAASPYDIILSLGLRSQSILGMSSGVGFSYGRLTIPVRKRRVIVVVPRFEPPVGQSLYHDLIEEYGPTKGKRVWGGMLLERKGPFAEGAKYDPDQPEVRKELVAAGLDPK